jgi:KRAB domain-containing zinc finger protein
VYSNFGEIKTKTNEIEPEILSNGTLKADEHERTDRVKEYDAIEYVEVQPFEMIECGEIKIESANKLKSGSKAILRETTTAEAIKQESSNKKYPPKQIATKATGERFLKKFHCTICNRYFMNQKTLAKHLKDHEERAKHVLTSDEVAKLPSNQISVSSTGEMYARRYKCSICNKYYISNECLSMHMRCHKRAPFAKKLTEEDLKHIPADRISTLQTGEKVLREQKCELCGKYFLTKDSLRVHMNDIHELKKKRTEKPQLLTEEESNQYPTNQIFIASSGDIFLRKYQCDICKKYILTKNTLFAHMRDVHYRTTNRRIGNHVCDTCGKGFKNRGALNAHKWIHSKTQRYICSYCGKGLKNKHALEEHTNAHLGLKPFKCRECGKTFGRKTLLKVHQRVHTGEKPFKCDQEGCERAYAHGSDLIRHLYGAHRIYKRKYECQVCPRIFHEKKLLTKHMLTHGYD